jgi:hypothetical protein
VRRVIENIGGNMAGSEPGGRVPTVGLSCPEYTGRRIEGNARQERLSERKAADVSAPGCERKMESLLLLRRAGRHAWVDLGPTGQD